MSISVIISAYNEEKNIENTIRFFLNYKKPLEIIVVNDGSTDNTSKILETFKKNIKIINLRKNKGKGYAMVKGVEVSKGDYILFFDADLYNLKSKHIDDITNIKLLEDYDMLVGNILKPIQNVPVFLTFDHLSGQRFCKKEMLIPLLKNMKKTRYGVETLFNRKFRNKIKWVHLKGVKHILKHKKTSKRQAVIDSFKEGIDVILEFSNIESISLSDYKILRKIENSETVSEIKKLVKRLENKKLKKYLKQLTTSMKKLITS